MPPESEQKTVRSSLANESCSPRNVAEIYVEHISGLMQEKLKVEQEEKKIKENKNLTFVDKHDAIK